MIFKSIQKKKADLKRIDDLRIKIINRLAKSSAEVDILLKNRAEYKKVNKSIRLYDLFIQATSKRGIPVQIICSLLPKIKMNSNLTMFLF